MRAELVLGWEEKKFSHDDDNIRDKFQLRVTVRPGVVVSIVAGAGLYCSYTEEEGQTFEVALILEDEVQEPEGWCTWDRVMEIVAEAHTYK